MRGIAKAILPMLRGVCLRLGALCLTPALAFASQPAHHEHGHGEIPWATLIFSTINLGLFTFVIARYAWPAIRDWLADRRRQIVAALEQAALAQQEAEQLKREWEQRLARLGAEIATMREQARAEIARERDQILAAAQKTAAALQRDAQRAAEQELRIAQAQLRRELARRAYTIAVDRARRQLTPADQERFVADFLERVAP
jgi:F-type H+-transporting ATPase subunit b